MTVETKPDEEFVLRRSEKPEETPYWQNDIESVLQPRTREMLETYSHIPADQVVEHIRKTQKRSWDVSPFASVGALTWLDPYILLHPAYERVLEKVKSGGSIVDCACMVAPDLRQLAYAGAPTENMYGFDVEEKFFDIAFDFYQDRKKWKGSFFQADAVLPFEETQIGSLIGKMDVIWCAKFIHIFDQEGQIDMASRLVKLLKPQPGSIFVGSQNGFPGGKNIPIGDGKKFAAQTDRFFMADVPHIEQMWAEVSKRTGTEWDLEARLLDFRTIGRHVDDGTPYKKITGYNIQWTAIMK